MTAGDGRFEGQCAIVTGASRGIGRAISVRLCEGGANVVCVSRSPANRASTGNAMVGLALDLADSGAGQRVVEFALEHFGRIDILIHGAGVIAFDTMAAASVAALDEMIAVNLRAPYLLTKAALRELTRTQGQVLFINSTVIRAANIAGRGGYAATKQALKAVADSLRDEVNEYGIRVISLVPGTTATDGQEKLHRMLGKPYDPGNLLQPEDVAQTACDALALPRTGEITDLYIRPMRKP
jgi:NAD(P)-dependent dehydrogenase (short-subunit alcohol dehydrogenase family)